MSDTKYALILIHLACFQLIDFLNLLSLVLNEYLFPFHLKLKISTVLDDFNSIGMLSIHWFSHLAVLSFEWISLSFSFETENINSVGCHTFIQSSNQSTFSSTFTFVGCYFFLFLLLEC